MKVFFLGTLGKGGGGVRGGDIISSLDVYTFFLSSCISIYHWHNLFYFVLSLLAGSDRFFAMLLACPTPVWEQRHGLRSWFRS